jgi:hypothetical protein
MHRNDGFELSEDCCKHRFHRRRSITFASRSSFPSSDRFQSEVSCDETRSHPRRTDFLLSCEVEGADLAGDTWWRHGLRLGPAAVRSGNRRDFAGTDRAPDRTDPGAVETVSGDGGHLAVERDEVQHLLHIRKTRRKRQHDLCALLPGRPAGVHFCLRAGMDRAVRYRNRLRRAGVISAKRGSASKRRPRLSYSGGPRNVFALADSGAIDCQC